jgi:hypothetical protein
MLDQKGSSVASWPCWPLVSPLPLSHPAVVVTSLPCLFAPAGPRDATGYPSLLAKACSPAGPRDGAAEQHGAGGARRARERAGGGGDRAAGAGESPAVFASRSCIRFSLPCSLLTPFLCWSRRGTPLPRGPGRFSCPPARAEGGRRGAAREAAGKCTYMLYLPRRPARRGKGSRRSMPTLKRIAMH